MLILNKKVIVTGGISCGKSSVCQLFEELGATVLSADEIVHQLLSPQTSLGHQLIQILGSDVVAHQEFDRAKIAKKVFERPELLQSLEHLLHPLVRQEIDREFQKFLHDRDHPLFVVEIPLYFEGKPDPNDVVVVVWANEEVALSRFKEKTGLSEKEFALRQSRQLPIKEKIAKATFVIENNLGLKELRQSVIQVFCALNY